MSAIGVLDTRLLGRRDRRARSRAATTSCCSAATPGPTGSGMRPDSISVVSIDAETGAAVIFGIPRNLERVPFSEGSPLYGPFPNGYDCGDDCLVSYLYTYGQEHPELYPDAESKGSTAGDRGDARCRRGHPRPRRIQYYVLIDMQGFADLIDALGGIDIDGRGAAAVRREHLRRRHAGAAGRLHRGRACSTWTGRPRSGTRGRGTASNDYERMDRQRAGAGGDAAAVRARQHRDEVPGGRGGRGRRSSRPTSRRRCSGTSSISAPRPASCRSRSSTSCRPSSTA